MTTYFTGKPILLSLLFLLKQSNLSICYDCKKIVVFFFFNFNQISKKNIGEISKRFFLVQPWSSRLHHSIFNIIKF